MSETAGKTGRKAIRIEPQPRDLDLLRGLYEGRCMTLRHAADLHFAGGYSYAKQRVRDLVDVRLVKRRTRGVGEADVLFLAKRGHDLLIERDALGGLPPMRWPALSKRSDVSPITLRHELEVMGVKAAFVRAVCAREDLEVMRFTTWPRLCRFRVRRPSPEPWEPDLLEVRPDGYLELLRTRADGGRARLFFYLEVDRSTEQLSALVRTAAAYRDHYRGGGFARRQGGKAGDWQRWPFRVLWTFKSPQRLANVAEAFANMPQPPGGQAWLAETARVAEDPLGAVWRTAALPEDQNLVPV